MKISENIKQNGILKICEKCNYDIRDIRLNLLRETDLSEKDDSQKSRALKEFKDFIKDKTKHIRDNHRIKEIKRKLKGDE